MERIQGTRKRERSPAVGSGISVYFVVEFLCNNSPWASVVYEAKIGMEEGEPKVVITGKEGEAMDPVLKFGENLGFVYVSCAVLGSDLHCFVGEWCWKWNAPVPPGMRSFIVNPQTNKISNQGQPAIATKVNPLVIPADGKLFVVSNTRFLAAGLPQPSFEVFDPNSGASETLPPAPFHSKDHYEAHHSIWVTGSVVIHDRFILVCVNDCRVKNSCFYSYHWGSRVWKSVPTIDGVFYPAFGGTACVVGGRIFGCSSSAGIPLSYEFSVGDTREKDRDAPNITLGSPVLYRDLVELCPINPEELRERSGTIVPFGKDMLCFFHTFYGSFTFESQHLSIKILQIQEDPLSLKVLSSTSRALNIRRQACNTLHQLHPGVIATNIDVIFDNSDCFFLSTPSLRCIVRAYQNQ